MHNNPYIVAVVWPRSWFDRDYKDDMDEDWKLYIPICRIQDCMWREFHSVACNYKSYKYPEHREYNQIYDYAKTRIVERKPTMQQAFAKTTDTYNSIKLDT